MSNIDGGQNSNDGEDGRPEAALRIARQQNDEMMKLMQGILRKDAARDAGLDLANPQHRFFVERYDGDLTSEAMRTMATQAGFIVDPAVQQQQQANQSTQGLERITSAGGQAGAGGGSSLNQRNPQDVALREEAAELMLKAKRRQGDPSEVLDWARRAGVPFVGEE